MTTIFRQAQDGAVGEPGQLIGKLLAFGAGHGQRERETVRQKAHADAFDTAELIDIGYDTFADLGAFRRKQRHATRRHVQGLAGKLPPIFKHVTPEQRYFDALIAATFTRIDERRGCRRRVQNRHVLYHESTVNDLGFQITRSSLRLNYSDCVRDCSNPPE